MSLIVLEDMREKGFNVENDFFSSFGEEVDPNAFEREVESDEEKESPDDEDEFEEEDAEFGISLASDDEYR
ncbi:hypothetical protein Taro_043201 [Colocasia esculenta]|uniref:Uncharacterized protein n=1 Tax=Colocasia esculenta TaxID=4460 RepID=A0A843X3R7_COLES|nr:hypothetical protein [Colocasia esculenta]